MILLRNLLFKIIIKLILFNIVIYVLSELINTLITNLINENIHILKFLDTLNLKNKKCHSLYIDKDLYFKFKFSKNFLKFSNVYNVTGENQLFYLIK